MSTIRDVAKRAGVSTATVSCCLSGAKPVNPDTRLRILQAIEELRYIPNAAARSLKMAQSKKIGLVLPDLGSVFYSDLLKGITSALQQEHYMVTILFTYGNPKSECEKIEALMDENVAGLLIVTCQPENTEFFSEHVIRYGTPAVFIHEKPAGITADCAEIDNRKTTRYLTDRLLRAGYEDILLVTGDMHFSSEELFCRGVRDAYTDFGRSFSEDRVYITNMTKENAFQATMEACRMKTPHAILSSSEQMTKGIKEALDIMGIRAPQDVYVATLGEESWNRSENLPGVLYSARKADQLGTGAARLLLGKIREPDSEPQTIVYSDSLPERSLDIPPRRERPEPPRTEPGGQQTLRILMLDTPSCRALGLLARHCQNAAGITLRCEMSGIRELLARIEEDSRRDEPAFDLYTFDTPWTAYLENGNYLEDLTPFVKETEAEKEHVFRKFWGNAEANGKYIGIPFIGATQVMFYRRDLFEKASVRKRYKERCGAELRPPKTWQEYNRTAEFFTRSYNPDSPTEFGTGLSGVSPEFLAPELMTRLWTFGGRLWDGAFHPCVDAPQNLRAYRNILDSFRYLGSSPFEVDAEAVTAAFCEGRTAMIIAFSEYAGQIRDALNQKVISSIGYDQIPGVPMRAGWNFGMNRHAPKERVYRFFRWLMEDSTSCYYTILGGQATTTTPYLNNEIMGLYPWMALTKMEQGRCYSRKSPPALKNGSLIPTSKIEFILCQALREAYVGGVPIHTALETAQWNMQALFRKYGYL